MTEKEYYRFVFHQIIAPLAISGWIGGKLFEFYTGDFYIGMFLGGGTGIAVAITGWFLRGKK